MIDKARIEEAAEQARDRRYYSPTDPESYVTPDRFQRMGKEKQVDYMVDWFRGMFEACLSALRIHILGVDCVCKMSSQSILHIVCVCINRIGTV